MLKDKTLRQNKTVCIYFVIYNIYSIYSIYKLLGCFCESSNHRRIMETCKFLCFFLFTLGFISLPPQAQNSVRGAMGGRGGASTCGLSPPIKLRFARRTETVR